MTISSYLSMIALNVNGLNSSKDIEWLDLKKKKKTQLYAAYKGPTSASRSHIG